MLWILRPSGHLQQSKERPFLKSRLVNVILGFCIVKKVEPKPDKKYSMTEKYSKLPSRFIVQYLIAFKWLVLPVLENCFYDLKKMNAYITLQYISIIKKCIQFEFLQSNRQKEISFPFHFRS